MQGSQNPALQLQVNTTATPAPQPEHKEPTPRQVVHKSTECAVTLPTQKGPKQKTRAWTRRQRTPGSIAPDEGGKT